VLSGRPVRFRNVRAAADEPGLRDHEVSFLRLIDKISNGSTIEIDHTGTDVFFRPGVLTGGRLTHDCPPSRAIGYFLEAMTWLAPFCKKPLVLILTGITNDSVDPCVRACVRR
jgi:RNA 3'-terminal phosphate cyclase-like protein